MKNKMKNKEKFFQGFTLIEVLLVIAIIGILASAVFVMIGDSGDAKRKAVLTTAKSILTYAQECHFNGEDLIFSGEGYTADGSDSGDIICNESTTEWPSLSVDECSYSSVTASAYEVNCGEIGNVECSAINGSCVVK